MGENTDVPTLDDPAYHQGLAARIGLASERAREADSAASAERALRDRAVLEAVNLGWTLAQVATAAQLSKSMTAKIIWQSGDKPDV